MGFRGAARVGRIRFRRWLLPLVLLAALAMAGPVPHAAAQAPTLEFESGGLTYKAQTRSGLTVMYAPLPTRVLGYSIIQVAISNGSTQDWLVRPEDFRFEAPAGTRIQAIAGSAVIRDVFDRAGRGDVGRLVAIYEAALFGVPEFRATNGYERRRRDAMGIGSTQMRAAAAASSIILAPTVLAPGQSTDGAVFLPNRDQPIGPGTLRMVASRPMMGTPQPQSPQPDPNRPAVAFDFDFPAPPALR